MKKTAYMLLGIWLIATGVVTLLGIVHPVITLAVWVLAVTAGFVILLGFWKMNQYERVGMILLAIWLLVSGLIAVVGLRFAYLGTIMVVLAILAGIFLLIGLKGKKAAGKIGMVLLAIWLLATEFIALLGIGFSGAGVALAILAIVAGILIQLG